MGAVGTVELQSPIAPRRLSFESALAELPKEFAAGGNVLHCHLNACLSAVFPDGEDYFVRSVRHYRGDLSDPVLKGQVAGFIGQEASHGREHRLLNLRLAELGYPVERIGRFCRWEIKHRERVMSPSANLAVTAAMEHFTAIMAEVLMAPNGAKESLGAEVLQNLFLWHALEESEHKSVAFDVFRAMSGKERQRVLIMKGTRLGFLFGITTIVLLSVLSDPRSRERGVLRSHWREFRTAPLFRREVWNALREYDAAQFHPSQRDTTSSEQYWRERLFGPTGEISNSSSSHQQEVQL